MANTTERTSLWDARWRLFRRLLSRTLMTRLTPSGSRVKRSDSEGFDSEEDWLRVVWQWRGLTPNGLTLKRSDSDWFDSEELWLLVVWQWIGLTPICLTVKRYALLILRLFSFLWLSLSFFCKSPFSFSLSVPLSISHHFYSTSIPFQLIFSLFFHSFLSLPISPSLFICFTLYVSLLLLYLYLPLSFSISFLLFLLITSVWQYSDEEYWDEDEEYDEEYDEDEDEEEELEATSRVNFDSRIKLNVAVDLKSKIIT